MRLYQSWRNMRSRVAGLIRTGSGEPIWHGLAIEWGTFEEFRTWALASGFSKTRCSLDRRRTSEGYGPGNCRWLTVRQNNVLAFHPDYFEMGGEPMFAEGGECPF